MLYFPLTKDLQDALDEALDTLVVALDIVGVIDRIWHERILEKFLPMVFGETF